MTPEQEVTVTTALEAAAMSALPAEKPGIPHAVPFVAWALTVAAIAFLAGAAWRGAQMIGG